MKNSSNLSNFRLIRLYLELLNKRDLGHKFPRKNIMLIQWRSPPPSTLDNTGIVYVVYKMMVPQGKAYFLTRRT